MKSGFLNIPYLIRDRNDKLKIKNDKLKIIAVALPCDKIEDADLWSAKM